MSLQAGDKLGQYEIVVPIGAGGMGEVYRARDTKLKRDVALKVLPESFAHDSERMARFQREAEVLASLNHPNIAHIYGVEDRALVMELVEGAEPKGPMPFDEAWKIASQIAAALEYAHDKGVVHRDLKPANVKVTPDGVVKLLDFGLAKAFTASPESSNQENSPTLTLAATQVGVILGTAAYMSPEQARGKNVDKRADIWAFGVLFYELLTGERLFQGEDVSETLAHVLTQPLDLSRAPARAQKLLRRCLEREPKRRLRDTGEAPFLIEEVAPIPVSGRRRSQPWVAWGAAAVLFAVAALVSFIHFREKPPALQLVRFQIPSPEKSRFIYGPSVSPDGQRIAFAAPGPGGRNVLWVHTLNSLDSRPLAGTEGVSDTPFWSPDGRFVAFMVPGKLKKVDASGGPPQTLCDLPAAPRGGAWSREGVIVVGIAGQGLLRVSEAGGAVTSLTKLDSSRQEAFHGTPSFLPDGRHFVYLRSAGSESGGIYLGSLDAKPEQQSSNRLLATQSAAVYAPGPEPGSPDSSVGHILFVREGSLMAQAFDVRRMELSGEAVPVAESLNDNGPRAFEASTTGVLVYRTGGGPSTAGTVTQLTWFDRAGKTLGTVGEPGMHNTLALSPDGTRVAFDRFAAGSRPHFDLWVHEFARNTSTQLTFDSNNTMAVWSPDGRRITFISNRDGDFNLYQKDANGAGNDEPLLKSPRQKYSHDWSPDGRFLLYATQGPYNLWLLPLTGDDHKPVSYLQTNANSAQARFSPDGRFVAYTSDAAGENDVYVQPFPQASGGKWKVGSGNQPHWRRDGKELFYISLDSKLMAVDMTTSPTFKAGVPKALFAAPVFGGGATQNFTHYDVLPTARNS